MAVLGVSPLSLNFGTVNVGSTSGQIIQLRNASGSGSVNNITLSFAGTKFTVTSYTPPETPPFSIIGITVNVLITYTPTGAVTDNDTLTITSDADNNPVQVALTGTGVAAGTKTMAIDPSGFIYPNTKVNTNSTNIIYTVTNTGTVSITVQIPAINGPFTGVGLPGAPTVLTAGSTFQFGVEFSPVTTGYVVQPNGIVLTSDATNSPINVDLEGLGVLIFPAYIALNGVENGYFAVGANLRQFLATNFTSEESTDLEKLWLLSGPGYEDTVLRMEIQYADLGVCMVTINLTNERGESDQVTQRVGSIQATGVTINKAEIRNTLFDFKITGELITMEMGVSGPLCMISMIPRYVPAGEVKK